MIKPGMDVWTVDRNGQRVITTVINSIRRPVAQKTELMQVVLSDGRQAWLAPAHPTSDGRAIQDLQPNQKYDRAQIVSVRPVVYEQGFTYDILPAGDTGYYWANGILVEVL